MSNMSFFQVLFCLLNETENLFLFFCFHFSALKRKNLVLLACGLTWACNYQSEFKTLTTLLCSSFHLLNILWLLFLILFNFFFVIYAKHYKWAHTVFPFSPVYLFRRIVFKWKAAATRGGQRERYSLTLIHSFKSFKITCYFDLKEIF